mmetsp:Transcript_46339/g.91848  ORF Transcript_46339/g.91848 Transcript_46339/m.91848 type:complete len:107 (-) Transcript_46339:375-695(-)
MGSCWLRGLRKKWSVKDPFPLEQVVPIRANPILSTCIFLQRKGRGRTNLLPVRMRRIPFTALCMGCFTYHPIHGDVIYQLLVWWHRLVLGDAPIELDELERQHGRR